MAECTVSSLRRSPHAPRGLSAANKSAAFVRVNSGVVATSQWDAMTTGQTQGFGTNTNSFSATGLATAQLQAPRRFDSTVWGGRQH